MSAPAPEWVDDQRALDELVEHLLTEPRYGLDTEFHRERTYFPKLALLQLAWSDGVALVDPLAVDVAPLARLLESDALAILHASQQDLEVLARACGTIPRRLFDTQLAASFVGYASPALVNLVHAELRVRLPKGDRLTDWLHRPLSADQRDYAASDVAHLLALHDVLTTELESRGRLAWALEECEALRRRPTGPPDPDTAWLRLKDHRHLRGPSRGVAQAVAAWRERRAAALDQPARFVLSDLALLSIAQRPPKTLEDLRRVRGVDERAVRGRAGEELLAAVREGLELPASAITEARPEEVPRELRPAVTLVSAWISQLARDLEIDTTLLATRADLVALLVGDADARLARSWRAEVVGDHVRRLVEGRAALAFDGKGQLVLEDRVPPG